MMKEHPMRMWMAPRRAVTQGLTDALLGCLPIDLSGSVPVPQQYRAGREADMT